MLGPIGLGEHHRPIAVEPRLLIDLGGVAALGQELDRGQHAVAVAGDRRIPGARHEGEGHGFLRWRMYRPAAAGAMAAD